MITVSVDRSSCIGCALCPSIDPAVFMMDDDNIAVVAAQPSPENAPEAVEAAESCPTDAITVLQ